MATKEEMIEWLEKNIPKTGNTTASTIRNFYQHQSETDTRIDYERELTKQQAAYAEARRNIPETPELKAARESAAAMIAERDAAYNDMLWSRICLVVIDGNTVQNTIANRTEISSWPDPSRGDVFGPDLLVKALRDTPSLKYRLSWEPAVDYSPTATKARNAQVEATTRATFHTLARDYDLSRCESNVQAVIQYFPEGADAFQIGEAIRNQQLNLAPCNKQEHLEYTKELETEYARKWKALPLHEMRKRSAECNAEREALLVRHSWKERGVLTKEDEAEARQQAIKVQEELLGYPVMPASIGETTLDAAYLRGCGRNQLMDAIRRWGSYQVNQRLVGK
jgi:hypothetical protein